jgi:hypothetical protein
MNLFKTILVITTVFIVMNAEAQSLRFPRESQAASVTQRIGLTDITINYSRPAVKGREIWGKLIPYNQVWRAGANENTTISFSDPVSVNGSNIEAGTYGLHTIPTEDQWTIVFSKQNTGWGSYAYDENEDALRIKVKPEKTEMTEWLEFSFTDPVKNSVTVNLKWEQLKVPFKIEVDVNQVVLKEMRKDLLGAAQFSWQSLNQAATFCANNMVNIDEGLKWAEKSISFNRNFTNMNTKARLLELKGDASESAELRQAALKIANEAEMNTYGYQLLNEKKIDEAISVFKDNIKKYPDSWNVYDSLGEAYSIKGENKLAVENYKIALSKVSDEQNKTRIQNTISQLNK